MTTEAAAAESDLAELRSCAASGYPVLWRRVVDEWVSTPGSAAWMTYSANYLCAHAGFRWAIDPFSMANRVAGIPAIDYARDMAPLSLVLLTHAHNDHLDLTLINALKTLDITWVVPSFMMEQIQAVGHVPGGQFVVPQPGATIYCGPLRLTPFESLHFHPGGGVPEMGYLVECEHWRWLFPGDIRSFNPAALPDFGSLDGVAAHLWLGKGCALDGSPPYLDAFCGFFSAFNVRRIVVTHLNEYGRPKNELWNERHYELVRAALVSHKAVARVEKAVMGDSFALNDTFLGR